MWWPEVELNHRHTDFQSVYLYPHVIVVIIYNIFLNPILKLKKAPFYLSAFCPQIYGLSALVRTIFGVKLLILLEAKGLKIRVSVVQFHLWPPAILWD